MERRTNPSRPMHATIRVVIAEDHNVIRQGLCMLLGDEPGFEVVDAVPNGRAALLACEQHRPDVALMDLFMPSLSGIQATTQIKRYVPKTRVVILSGATTEDHVVDALRAGADGYLGKSADIQEVALAIRSVTRGNRYFSREIATAFDLATIEERARSSEAGSSFDRLTPREREVLQLIGEGRTNQEIAAELFVTVKTVEAHRAHLKEKLNARNRRDLIMAALHAGLIQPAAGTEFATAGSRAG